MKTSIVYGLLIVMLVMFAAGCSNLPAGSGKRGVTPPTELTSPFAQPQVWCAYFPYFQTDNFAQWWYPGKDPTYVIGPEPWRRAIWVGNPDDYPYIGTYNNVSDREILRWHIRLAKAAGISAFIVYLYNWEEQATATQLLLDVAAEENFMIGLGEQHSYLGAVARSILDGRPQPILSRQYVGYDTIMANYSRQTGLLPSSKTQYTRPIPRSVREIPRDAIEQASERIAGMLKTWKAHPAYLRVDGKPGVVIPYLDATLEPADLKQLTANIEAAVHEDVYVVAIIPQVYWYFDPQYVKNSGITDQWAHTGVEAFTHWTPNGMVTAPQKLRQEVTAFHVQNSLAWRKDPIIPVMPGFNDDAWQPGDDPSPTVARRNGETWRDQLEAALAAKPRVIFIHAWNAWQDGSQIEPSTAYGEPYWYLQILAGKLGIAWSAPALPPKSNVDPLRVPYLPY